MGGMRFDPTEALWQSVFHLTATARSNIIPDHLEKGPKKSGCADLPLLRPTLPLYLAVGAMAPVSSIELYDSLTWLIGSPFHSETSTDKIMKQLACLFPLEKASLFVCNEGDVGPVFQGARLEHVLHPRDTLEQVQGALFWWGKLTRGGLNGSVDKSTPFPFVCIRKVGD